jgi:hypothetical protein
MNKLEELDALVNAATPGPWKVTGELGIEGQANSSTDFDPLVIGGLKGGKGLINFPSYSLYSQPSRTQGKANAALIVWLVNNAPAMLRAQAEEIAQLKIGLEIAEKLYRETLGLKGGGYG